MRQGSNLRSPCGPRPVSTRLPYLSATHPARVIWTSGWDSNPRGECALPADLQSAPFGRALAPDVGVRFWRPDGNGGGQRIRTPETFRFACFRDRCIQPDSASPPCPPSSDRGQRGIWWKRSGSNRRHPACKAGALPTELRPRAGRGRRRSEMVPRVGFEPTTTRSTNGRLDRAGFLGSKDWCRRRDSNPHATRTLVPETSASASFATPAIFRSDPDGRGSRASIRVGRLGGSSRDRTENLRIKNPPLYRLS